MCIRDRYSVLARSGYFDVKELSTFRQLNSRLQGHPTTHEGCLLYTSDAADERSSVDLGGRRIIKKKKKEHDREEQNILTR